MLTLLLLHAPRGLGRERAQTALLLLCMAAAIMLQLVLCTETRLADRAWRLRDGSEIVRVDPRQAAAARLGAATTRVRIADATLHGASPSTERIAFVDQDFPQVFGLASCRGSIAHALSRGNEIVPVASAARRLFGNADPIGRSLIVSVGDEALVLRIGAIACDPPALPRMRFTMLAALGASQPQDQGQAGSAADIPTYLRIPASSAGPETAGVLRDAAGASARPDASGRQAPNGAARTGGAIAFLVVLLHAAGWSVARLSPRHREAALYRTGRATGHRAAAVLALDPVLLVAIAGLLAVGATEWLFGGTLPYGGADGVIATLATRCGAALCALAVAPLAVAIGGRRPPDRRSRAGRSVARVIRAAVAALAIVQVGLATILLAFGGALVAPLVGLAGERGHDPAEVLVIGSLADPAVTAAQRRSLLRSFAQVDGVTGIGAATRLVGQGLPRATVTHGRVHVAVPFAQVDPGALSALRVQRLAGRWDAPGIVLTTGLARDLGFATPAAALGAVLGGFPGPVRAVVRDLRFAPDETGASIDLLEVSATPPPTVAALVRATDPPRTAAAMRAIWSATAPDVPFDAVPLQAAERTAWSRARHAAVPLAAAMLVACLSVLVSLLAIAVRIGPMLAVVVALGAGMAAILLRIPHIWSGFGPATPLVGLGVLAIATAAAPAAIVAIVGDWLGRKRRPMRSSAI